MVKWLSVLELPNNTVKTNLFSIVYFIQTNRFLDRRHLNDTDFDSHRMLGLSSWLREGLETTGEPEQRGGEGGEGGEREEGEKGDNSLHYFIHQIFRMLSNWVMKLRCNVFLVAKFTFIYLANTSVTLVIIFFISFHASLGRDI